MTRLLDPTSQVERKSLDFAPRLESWPGQRSACSTSTRPRASFPGPSRRSPGPAVRVKEVLRRRKVTPGRTVPVEVKQELLERCDAVIKP